MGYFRLTIPPAGVLRACACLWLAFLVVPASAESLVVVTHPNSSLSGVSVEDVAALYLDRKRGLGDVDRVVPLDLKSRDVRADFYLRVTKRSLTQLRAYWSKQVFTGKGRPPRAYTDTELHEFLSAHPDAIGYLPQSRVGSLKPLLVLE